jgi:hypothetical protein
MGLQLTDPSIPFLVTSGLNLQDYGTYVRKFTSGGTQDFKLTLADLVATNQVMVANNKDQMRTLNPQAADKVCFCKGGNVPFDNKAGIYITVQANDLDNDGDRIRPDNFIGFVWYKYL